MFPKRGAVATLLTVALLIFLLNYRTPTIPSSADFMGDGGPTDSPTLPAFAIGATPSGSDMVAMASEDAAASDGIDPATGGSDATPDTTATATDAKTSGGAGPTQPASGSGASSGGSSGAGATPTPVRAATPAPTRAPAPAPTQVPTPRPTPTPAPAGYTGSIAGSVVTTKYGPMQVKVVWSGGKITDVVTLQSTNASGQSRSISGYACPILRSEALKAQSASIATVSGATYTSNGYKQSMQSALSKLP